MKRMVKLLLVAGLLWGVAGSAVLAQSVDAAPRVYKLERGSSFEQGCFPPCLCPSLEPQDLKGTFSLTYTGSDPLYDYYHVSAVNWTTGLTGVRITGSGTYRLGGEVALTQRLELRLSLDGGETEYFDSGVVPVDAQFPNIAVTVSMNNMVCYDTVITIIAAPVRQIVPYRLRGSTYQHGCWDPCDCPLFAEQPLTGSFGLVKLEEGPLFTEYALVNIHWAVLPLGPSGRKSLVTGVGNYKVGGEFAAQHQLIMDLQLDGGPVTRFDSGLVIGGTRFPAIDIVATVNGFYCYDQVIRLRAVPARTTIASSD